ncbi:1-deoxy-D-xylulose-5-phosphate synthase N-terminal domain-containing protein [soil metagenome]
MSSKPSARDSVNAKNSATKPSKDFSNSPIRAPKEVLDRICGRAHYLTTQMIWLANNREKDKGDPKVGGHPAACASSLHITGALHLIVKSGFDYIANKPHAAPVDHSYNYLLKLMLKNAATSHEVDFASHGPDFLGQDISRLSQEDMDLAMQGLRKFSKNGEPVFQSYHSAYDSDHHGFLPSGTVGIPPVNAGYLAHAFRFAKDHGYDVPDAHFWSIIGDSEFREGSLHEAIPDFAERELGNLTWIVDYNRQSLDGHRITNKEIMNGTDDKRIARTLAANGWDVIQVQHGTKRLELFKRPGGDVFKKFLEEDLQDYELQSLLLVHDMASLRSGLMKSHTQLKTFLGSITDQELFWALRDLGGHDIITLAKAMMQSKENPRKPTMIIAHTLKGWGLESAAKSGNHSSLPDQEEVDALRRAQSLSFDKGDKLAEGRYFEGLDEKTEEGKYCKQRGEELYGDIKTQYALRDKNWAAFQDRMKSNGEIPVAMGISLKMAQYPHTQWMLGQLTAKLTRIANASPETAKPEELPWRVPAELLVTMAPDVGTSTNLNPAMDGHIFGAAVTTDIEAELGVKDKKLPDLVPGEENTDRFIRFEIAESNVMSCVGSYGKMREFLGIPILPLMTVYDFFIKRAHDQFFYNMYWKSSFICVGTPAGVTLSPEGAQHGWKSDFQIPNQITWEPFFCQELDWIMSESVRRHMSGDNAGRTGVVIRGVTRGAEQKAFALHLKRQLRFKKDRSQLLHATAFEMPGAVDEASIEAMSEEEMFNVVREDVLAGAYYLVDYRGYAGYEPGDNVVNIFSLGSLTTEALKASDTLLRRGIYANVIVVTSTDLMLGVQGHADDYALLKERLQLNANLHLVPTAHRNEQTNGQGNGHGTPELITVAGRRVPCVSVHDGEPGLMDNIGSVLGVRQEALAVRKHSKCGRPNEIYEYHHLDGDSIVEAVGKVLSETALEQVQIAPHVLQTLQDQPEVAKTDWRDLWPERASDTH